MEIGAQVPDVKLIDTDGEEVRLRDRVGTKTLVIYFYPKDDTQVCTTQACGFRDRYEDFVDAGAEVIGISSDPPASHRSFASKYRLPFTLLTDPSGEARKAFGVKPTLGFHPGRTTYVVDREGAVRLVFSSALRAGAHVKQALEMVRELSAGSP